MPGYRDKWTPCFLSAPVLPLLFVATTPCRGWMVVRHCSVKAGPCSEGGFAAVNLHADPVMSLAWAPACQVLSAHSRLVFLRAVYQDTVAEALGGFPVSTKSVLPHDTFLWVLSGT